MSLRKINPNILVGCPTWKGKKYCLEDYYYGVKRIDYDNFDVLLVDNSEDDEYIKEIKSYGLPAIKGRHLESAKERVVFSRNLLREHALKNNYDYFFSLEQDVIPDPDIIKRLLAHKKEIVSGVVFNNLPWENEIRCLPMAYVQSKEDPTGLWYISVDQLANPELSEVKAVSLSCVLIHRNVLEKIKFRFAQGFDDMLFCKDAVESGHKIFLDTTIRPKHLH